MVEFDDVIVVFRIRSRTTTRSRPRRVSERVGSPSQLFLLALSDANLNIIVLGSYDGLIGIDCLEDHKTKKEYYNMSLEFLNDEGEGRKLQG